MDHELGVGEVEPDDLEEVAGGVGADGEHLRRVSVGLQVHDDDRELNSMTDGLFVVVVLER